MIKNVIGALAILSISAYGSPSNCLLEEMSPLESSVVTFFQPYNNCKEVRSEKGELVGVRIIKESAIITASYGNYTDFHPDSLVLKNSSKRISSRELFWSLFSNDTAINEFVKIQRERINHAAIKGILMKKDSIAFYELGAKHAPEPHSITYFFDPNNPDKYFSIGLTNIDKADAMLLLLNME